MHINQAFKMTFAKGTNKSDETGKYEKEKLQEDSAMQEGRYSEKNRREDKNLQGAVVGGPHILHNGIIITMDKVARAAKAVVQ